MTQERMICEKDTDYDRDENPIVIWVPIEPAPPKDFEPKCAEIFAIDGTLLCSVCNKRDECIYRKKE